MERLRERQHVRYVPNVYTFGMTAEEIHEKNRDWSIDECRRIAAGQVWIGMTYNMLLYRRGRPDVDNVSNYGAGEEHQWCWTHDTPSCVYDRDGDGKMDAYN